MKQTYALNHLGCIDFPMDWAPSCSHPACLVLTWHLRTSTGSIVAPGMDEGWREHLDGSLPAVRKPEGVAGAPRGWDTQPQPLPGARASPQWGKLPEMTPAKRSWKEGGRGSDPFCRPSCRSPGAAWGWGSIHLGGPRALETQLPSSEASAFLRCSKHHN